MKNTTKKKTGFWIAVALLLCLISSIGASIIQTNFGSVTYHDLTIVTQSGHEMNALLLVPDGVSAENKAPAIVVTHGWHSNREAMDLNYVEYARRGYVVMAISMYGHGDSEVIENDTWWNAENNANGIYDAVKYVAELPYVDTDRIGITGHSAGAQGCRNAVLMDEDGLIAAALLVCNDAVYTDENGEFYNQFGDRDAAIVACQYDEFFHRVNGNAPRDFIHQDAAQSFLYFGENPSGMEERESYTFYTQDIDGTEAIRAIFNPVNIHQGALLSKGVVASSVEFFDRALDAPVKLAHTDQIWPWKTCFNLLGVIGFFLFLIHAVLAMLELPFFADLKADGEVLPAKARSGKSKGRYIRRQIISVVWAIITFFLCFFAGYLVYPKFLNQEVSRCLGYWAVVTGLLMLWQMHRAKKKGDADPEAMGSKISKTALGKSILLAIAAVAASYTLVFLSDAIFKTDYRFWALALIRAFDLKHLGTALKFVPLWMMYYIPLSVSANCYNYVDMGGKRAKSILVTMFWIVLAPILMIAAQYIVFFSTGFMLTEAITGTAVLWLFPMVVYMPLAVWICHKIYLKTKNPYIGGIIMAILVTLFNVTNTLTVIG